MPTLTRGSFAKAGTSIQLNTGSWRVRHPEHRRQKAPCAGACPAGENPRDYLAKAAQGDLRAAWEALIKFNPLPAITGRVCHHPCEKACHRGTYDEAIAIHNVERFLGDKAIAKGWNLPITPPSASGPPVAVIGAGPAGLSAAYHLTAEGSRVTLFDAQPQAGGLLRSALASYRLPREVLDAESERLLGIGIGFQPNRRLGRDFSLDELRIDFRAIFLAIGTNQPRPWSVDGARPADLRNGLDLLKEWISMGALPSCQRVAIVGGGNTAIDMARVLKFAGAEEVHVVTFQSIPRAGVDPADVMSATPREIGQAMEEGVKIHEHRGVHRLILRNGTVVGLEIVHMKELGRPGGVRQPVAFEGTETVLRVDQVIPAIGQVVDSTGLESLLAGKPFLTPDEFGRLAEHPGVYAGGDICAGGGGSVSRAIGDGRRAALAIRAYVDGTEPLHPEPCEAIAFNSLNVNYFEHAQRVQAPLLPLPERNAEREIQGSLAPAAIQHEALRCFSCGDCMACDNCWTLCPDNSVLKARGSADEPWHYLFDYDHCKGCGICAQECPVGFIAMVAEP
jgi:2-oxoacid:acceptor oxidoreductase delta subunit (pyruvate/2-ketoisovalerate family)